MLSRWVEKSRFLVGGASGWNSVQGTHVGRHPWTLGRASWRSGEGGGGPGACLSLGRASAATPVRKGLLSRKRAELGTGLRSNPLTPRMWLGQWPCASDLSWDPGPITPTWRALLGLDSARSSSEQKKREQLFPWTPVFPGLDLHPVHPFLLWGDPPRIQRGGKWPRPCPVLSAPGTCWGEVWVEGPSTP